MTVIEISDDVRVRVEPDEGVDCPRADRFVMTGFAKVHGMGDSRLLDVLPVHDDPTGRICEAFAHDRFRGGVPYHTDLLYRRMERAQRFAERWARVFHGMHIEWDDEHGGFWFVDRKAAAESWLEEDLTLERQAEIIAVDRETYRVWAEGEVASVLLERKVRWARVDANDERVFLVDGDVVRETWEIDDSIGGCYLDDTYTAAHVALEHFDLDDDEEATLRAAAGLASPAVTP